MARTKATHVKTLILDVDGVLTDGGFYYTEAGKVMKRFGPDDSDALLILRRHMSVVAVSGDKRGFPITRKRVEEDMKLPLSAVSTADRLAWIQEHYALSETIYMGDGIFDSTVFESVGYAIAPANAFPRTKEMADFVTSSRGGDGAVAEACMHILETFFEPLSAADLRLDQGEGVWKQ